MPGTRDASKYRERAEKWREEAEALRLARNGTRAWCSPRGTRTLPRLSRKRTLVALADREAIDAPQALPSGPCCGSSSGNACRVADLADARGDLNAIFEPSPPSSGDGAASRMLTDCCSDYPPYVKVGIAFRASLLAPGIATFVSSLFISR
jgi:hypothetical protein